MSRDDTESEDGSGVLWEPSTTLPEGFRSNRYLVCARGVRASAVRAIEGTRYGLGGV